MSVLASTTVDLARAQFATTSIYHFLFVPLTLGLGPIVATFQTLWYRTRNENWLRLTRFFGTLFLINFAIGVATGLVQEFQFGMNWAVYSRFVGNVFGAPLAIEGLAAFFLESTFLGLWIFGWNRLSPRLHLATLWIAVLGTWMSAYFILVANSFMQDPVGYKVVDGQAQLTSVWKLLSSNWALWAFGHTIFAGLTAGAAVVFGVCCWHFARGRNLEVFKPAAKVALIVLVPIASRQPLVREPLRDPRHRAAADEDRRERGAVGHVLELRVLALPDRRLHRVRPEAELLDRDPGHALVPRHRLAPRHGAGLNAAEPAVPEAVRHANQSYLPPVRTIYWSMRGMAYAGSFVALVAIVGAFLYWRGLLETAALVPLGRGCELVLPVRRRLVRLGADRDGAAAVDRPGPAPDRERELAEREHDLDRDQPRRLRLAVRHCCSSSTSG